jgi:glycosyltransferase involved in cell wall biosynthesis
MDETNFGVLFNDVDLCLKIGEKGLRVVWTPYTTLIHHGSATLNARYRDSDSSEQSQISINSSKETDYFIRKWMRYLANDPAYNRHLSLTFSNASIESIMPCNWDVNFHDRQRILGLPLSGGSGEYRVIHPLDALSFAGLAQCEYYRFGDDKTRDISLSEFARLAPDTIIFHAAVNDIQLGLLKNISTYMDDVFCIYTIDDLLTNVPEQSAAYKDTQRYFSDAKARLRKGLSYCDRLVVSTQPLADLCADMIDDIRVVPNRLKGDPWASLTSLRNQSDKPRVGWAGAQQHQGDLAVITEVVKQTANEVDWIFMGMCPDELRPYIKEFHDFVAIDRYPQKLASLNLDLAVAPLEFHPFNESKSNLRLLEYGALGWPVICTDIYPYQTDDAPVTLIDNQTERWVGAIRDALANPDKLHHSGDRLKKWVLDNYIIEEHLNEWMSALVKVDK